MVLGNGSCARGIVRGFADATTNEQVCLVPFNGNSEACCSCIMDGANYLDDPSAAASRTLAADDMAYWCAHPELPGLVAHFMAKVLEQRPSDTLAFARETFCHRNLKEQVDQAIARNGGIFDVEKQRQKAPGTASRSRRGGGGKERTSREKEPREKRSRDKKAATR